MGQETKNPLATFWRALLRSLCAVAGLWLLALSTPALAAADTYLIYFNSDANPATGCQATLTDRYGSLTVGGFEYRLSIPVDAAGNAGQPMLAACQGGAFGADAPAGQAAAAQALRPSGANLLAQLELSVPASAVAASGTTQVVLAANGDYIRFAKAGGVTSPISLVSSPLSASATTTGIPTTSPLLLATLALALGVIGLLAVRRKHLRHALPLLLIAFMGVGIAASTALVIDGNTDDWQGTQPIATGMTGNQVPGTTDLFSLSAQFQNQNLFLRIDTIAGVNPNRDPSPQETASAQPRFTSQPSLNINVGQSWSYTVQASSAAGQPLAATLTDAPAGLQLSGSAPNQQLTWTPTTAGTYWVTLQVQDGAGSQTQKFPLYVGDDSNLPPDPQTIATALAPVGFTSFAERTAFLYQSAIPVQTGVQSGAIDPVTATVVRGKALDNQGQPMPGVTVSVAGHPEWGQTQTRADGTFDLAAGGGGWITINYQKLGYMRVQRRFQAPWRDFAYAPDVTLLPYDSQYSNIDLTAGTAQLYWGARQSDGRGQRRASVYFPAGTQANMLMPDGSTQSLPQFTMRVTEYTVGAAGPQAMPGQLPMSVGYTWAANFTADEAEAASAKSIQFNRPVVVYVDNFIDMPAGTAVPVGWYDFDKTAWIGEENGRIIKILGVDGQGQAILQVTTDARPATAQELQALGIDSEELKQLGSTRAVGDVLWRVAVTHLTPYDCNWAYGPPDDAKPPPTDQPPQPPGDNTQPSSGNTQPSNDNTPPPDDPPNTCLPTGAGCDVFFTQRALGQGIDLPGTPLALYFRSDRVGKGPQTLQVRLTDITPLPASLEHIDVTVQVVGTTQKQSWGDWSANQMANFTWNGMDSYGRPQINGANATITVSYVYPMVYYPVRTDMNRAFEQLQARIGDTVANISSDSSGMAAVVSRSYTRYLARVNVHSAELGLAGAGDWALKGLRLYDPEAGRVYESGGRIWTAARQPRGFSPLTDVLLGINIPGAGNSAIGADGALYYSDTNANQIRRVWLYGARKSMVETLGGTGAAGFSGDGGAATAAQLNQPTALALAPDGSIVFMDSGNWRLRRISTAGIIETLAGNGQPDTAAMTLGDSVPAESQPISAQNIAVAGDMTVFVWTLQEMGSYYEFRQISPAGYVSRLNLTGEYVDSQTTGLTSAPTGKVWLNTSGGLYQLTDAGTLSFIANGVSSATSLLPDTQGGIFYTDANGTLNYVSRAGGTTTLPGQGFNFVVTSSGLVSTLGVAPGGDLIASSYSDSGDGILVGTLGAGLPAFGDPAYRVARPDGTTIDEFDRQGRPVVTRSTFGGQALLTYQYGPTGQLSAITDSYGNTTTLTRDANGLLTAVTGPFGQTTTLSYNGSGQLIDVMQPGGLQYAMQYVSPSLGLLTRYQDPQGNVDQFSYDANGLLTTNTDPVGGGWRLSGSADSADYWGDNITYSSIAQSAEGRSSSYVTSQTPWSYTNVATAPDGTKTSRVLSNGSNLTETQPSGARIDASLWSDPRLGGAVLRSQTINTNDNYLSMYISQGRSLSNAQAADAWQNPQNWSETTTLNYNYSWVTRYQSPGLFTQTTPLGRTSSVQLDAHQQPISATLPSGLQLSASYNSAGQVTGISSTDGTTTRTANITWNAIGPGGGKPASLSNALGQTAHFAWDAAGRLTTQTLPDGRTLQYQWDGVGNLTSLTTPAGIVHSFNYNGVQLPTGYTPQGGAVTQWNYDRDRLLTSIVRPGGAALTVQRDAASGRVNALVDSVSGSTQLSYDSAGRVIKAATQDGQAITLDYGGTALLKNVSLNLQGTSANLGLALEKAYAGYLVTSYLVNPRLGQITLTAGGITQDIKATYDSDGLLTQNGPLLLGRDMASGQLAALTLGNLVTSEQRDAWGEVASSQTYSQQSTFGSNLQNNRQAVAALVSALGTQLSSVINARGDCVTWRPVNGNDPDQAPSETPTPVPAGGQSNLPWPPQPPQWISSDYCQQNLQYQIASLLMAVNTGTPATISNQLQYLIDNFSNGPSGFVQASQMLTGVPSTFNTSYIDSTAQSLIDQINATLQVWQTDQSNWDVAFAQTHSRDALGRITQTQETLLGASTPTTKSYTYDQSGRLTSATIGGTTTTWAYDLNGNRTTENGSPIATYDSQDRLLTWKSNSYSYNQAGDLASKTTLGGVNNYTYDASGNLRKVTLENGKTITYAIDPLGRRTGKSINGARQWQLVWMNGLRPIARLKADNTLDQTYYYGDKPNVPEAMSASDGKTYRIVSDQNGSVRLVINAATGEVAQQIDYDVWGQVINDTNPGFQPFGFAGGLYDAETGLTRFGARDYDAETGRWTAKDPILFGGGDSNLYGYVLQDPVNWSDPEGLKPVEYYLKEWICGSSTWGGAFDAAYEGKKGPYDPNDFNDADNRTAAEHYIFVRDMRYDGGAKGYLNAWLGWAAPSIYFWAKATHIWQVMMDRKTSPASSTQARWGAKAWWDSFDDNFNQFSSFAPNNSCGCSQ